MEGYGSMISEVAPFRIAVSPIMPIRPPTWTPAMYFPTRKVSCLVCAYAYRQTAYPIMGYIHSTSRSRSPSRSPNRPSSTMTDENIAIAIAVPVPQRLVNYGSVVLVAAKADISARRSDTPDGANGKDELDSRELRKSARREYHKCIERKRRSCGEQGPDAGIIRGAASADATCGANGQECGPSRRNQADSIVVSALVS
eukprot:1126921-Rhodomonas_salina.1